MSRDSNPRIALAGAVSGGFWFLVALAFDKGVQDFNYPVIAANSVPAVVASAMGAVVTGIAISTVFRRPLLAGSRIVLVGLPILALPCALTLFSVLSWIAWLCFGVTKGVPIFHRLGDSLSFFLLYGLVSLFTPVLFALALLNQWAIRRLLGHAADEAARRNPPRSNRLP